MNTLVKSNLASFSYFVPELLVIIGILALIILELVFKKETKRKFATLFTLATLIIGFIAVIGVGMPKNHQFLFNRMLVYDGVAYYFRILFFLSTFFIVLLSYISVEISEKEYTETMILMLSLLVMMDLLASSFNMLMLYLSLEGVSLLSYILTANKRGDVRAAEAGLKYTIYGGVASGVMLFGFSLLYGLTGSLDLTAIMKNLSGQYGALIFVAAILIIVGFGYKIAAVPFHQWSPDVYEGAPTPVTAFLSIGPKAAGFAILARFFYNVFSNGTAPLKFFPWLLIFWLLSVATMLVGNYAAINQNNLKRLLAYSSIAHAGYMLMGMTFVGHLGLRAIFFYLFAYFIMNLGAFAVVSFMVNKTGSEEIGDYLGLGRTEPLVAVAFTIFLLSLTGIPPTVGFIGKFYLLIGVIFKGGFLYYLLAFIAVFFTVISLFYYARVLKRMYLDPVEELKEVGFGVYEKAYVSVLAIPVIILGIYWQPLMHLIQKALESSVF